MQTGTMKAMIAMDDRALEVNPGDAFAIAVKNAVEVGSLSPTLLRQGLEKAGFVVSGDPAEHAKDGYATPKALQRVAVKDSTGKLVAQGAAGDAGEALAHAALGYLRETLVGR